LAAVKAWAREEADRLLTEQNKPPLDSRYKDGDDRDRLPRVYWRQINEPDPEFDTPEVEQHAFRALRELRKAIDNVKMVSDEICAIYRAELESGYEPDLEGDLCYGAALAASNITPLFAPIEKELSEFDLSQPKGRAASYIVTPLERVVRLFGVPDRMCVVVGEPERGAPRLWWYEHRAPTKRDLTLLALIDGVFGVGDAQKFVAYAKTRYQGPTVQGCFNYFAEQVRQALKRAGVLA
jgi:hypothetical protein